MEPIREEQSYMASEIDLTAVIGSLWSRKKFIISFTLACAVFSALLSLLIPNRYESRGVMQFASLEQNQVNKVKFRYGQSIPDYRKIESRLLNRELFCDLLADDSSLPEEKKTEIVSVMLKSTGLLAKRIEPVYASSRDDARLLGGSVLGKDETNSVIGFKLNWQDASPEDARSMVAFLERHIRNQMAYDALVTHITTAVSDYSIRLVDLDNKKIEAEFDLERLHSKLEEIRLMMKRYPGVDASGSRQIVSTQEGGYRFLPPANQAVGIESQITDIKQQLLVVERDLKVAAWGLEFYKDLAVLTENGANGETLLTGYDEQVKQFAQSHDLTEDTVKEFYNTVTIHNEEFKKTFNQAYKFISAPTLPTRHISPRRSIIVMAVTFLSFFISLFIVLIGQWLSNQKIRL